jgi:hypothetical protein
MWQSTPIASLHLDDVDLRQNAVKLQTASHIAMPA